MCLIVMTMCTSLRISTISPVVGSQASVTSGWVDWARGEMTHSSTIPPVLLSVLSERKIEEEKERVREGLFVRLREQSGLKAVAGQPGPRREKKRAFKMGTDRTADISTLRRTKTAKGIEKGGEQFNR